MGYDRSLGSFCMKSFDFVVEDGNVENATLWINERGIMSQKKIRGWIAVINLHGDIRLLQQLLERSQFLGTLTAERLNKMNL
jgi:hypothetical protein